MYIYALPLPDLLYEIYGRKRCMNIHTYIHMPDLHNPYPFANLKITTINSTYCIIYSGFGTLCWRPSE